MKYMYRKRPCISCTFFHKIEAKNQGCGLSMDTSVFEVLKNLIAFSRNERTHPNLVSQAREIEIFWTANWPPL